MPGAINKSRTDRYLVGSGFCFKEACVKLFSIRFTGHWPVRAVGVVLAESRDDAIQNMKVALATRGLSTELDDDDITEIDMTRPGVHILLDGDY